MKEEDKIQIQRLFAEKIGNKDNPNYTQSTVAVQAGFSEANVNNIYNGKNLAGIGNKIWMLAAKWCGYSTAKSQWVIRDTRNLRSTINMLTDAQENGKMMLLAGETGFGKTTGLAEYTKIAGGGNTYRMLWTHTMSKKDFLNAILKAIGLQMEGSIHEKTMAIVNKLNTTTYPLLIIDTCGEVKDCCFRLIQVIYDYTHTRAGIVLCGTTAFMKYINKMADKDKMGFRELRRRIEYTLLLEGPKPTFIAGIANEYGITELSAVKWLQDNCHDYGTLANVIENYLKAVSLNSHLGQREILDGLHNYTKAA